MALPGVSALPGIPRDLGIISASLATQHLEWPLETVASLLVPYLERLARQPDLDLAIASPIVESHVTPDLRQQKGYTPFSVEQTAFPPPFLALFSAKSVKTGVISSLNIVWATTPHRTLFWDLNTNEVQEFSLAQPNFGEICSVVGGAPNREVFSPDVKHVLIVSSANQMALVAVTTENQFVSTDLSIEIDGPPLVAVSPSGRVFFTTSATQTALFEFKYHQKEGWFRSRSEKASYNSSSNFLARFLGPSGSESVVQLVVDEMQQIYMLTSTGKLLVFSNASSPSLVQTFTLEMMQRAAQRAKSAPSNYGPNSHPNSHPNSGPNSHPNSGPNSGLNGPNSGLNGPNSGPTKTSHPQPTTPATIVSISPVSAKDSQFIRLVALTSHGDRWYFRTPHSNSGVTLLELTRAQPLPAPCATSSESSVCNGRFTYAVVQNQANSGYQLLAAAVDEARIAYVGDQGAPPPFVELCGYLGLDSCVLSSASLPNAHCVLTETSLYRIQPRPLSDRFEYADVPLALVAVYGAMQLCEAALTRASRPQTSLNARENAIAAFFRFGGAPSLVREPLPPGFANPSSVRLSASFDGLAARLARVLRPIWDQKILGTALEICVPEPDLLNDVYAKLSPLVNVLNANRGFSEAGSERGLALSTDDAAVLSQGETRGRFAMARLARSSQEGLAFLRLCLAPESATHLLSYFDSAKLPAFRSMTYGQFFTQARSSLVARELVNSLVNFVLSRNESVDAVAAIIQDRCASYCSTADVLEYKALECIHRAKKSVPADSALLAQSVALVQRAAASISHETLRDIMRDYVTLRFYAGAVQTALAVAAEQDPANLAVSFLRNRFSKNDGSEVVNEVSEFPFKRIAGAGGEPIAREPLSDSERQFQAKTAVYELVFSEVLAQAPELADAGCADPARAAMLSSPDEVWHFALYDWYLVNRPPDQIALLDTPFVATYLELGAARDLRVADLLWKWHQRHNDRLAAADVLLDLARGPLVPTLSMRVAYLSRAQSYAQTPSNSASLASANLLTMVRAYLNLALIQSDILEQLEQRAGEGEFAHSPALNGKIFTISELYNEWAQPNELYEVCFAIFAYADLRDPVEIQSCWTNLLTTTRAEDGGSGVPHYAHVAELVKRIGQNFRLVEWIFPVAKLVPMLEQYATDYCESAPLGWLVDAFVGGGVPLSTLRQVYENALADRQLEGVHSEHAAASLAYVKKLEKANGEESV